MSFSLGSPFSASVTDFWKKIPKPVIFQGRGWYLNVIIVVIVIVIVIVVVVVIVIVIVVIIITIIIQKYETN